MSDVSFSQRLRQALGKRPQSWLARRTGLEKSTISRLLGGTHQPTAETVHMIAVALEISAADLVEGTAAAPRLEARAAFVRRSDFDEVLARFVAEEGRSRDAEARAQGLRDELHRERDTSRMLRAEAGVLQRRLAESDAQARTLAGQLDVARQETAAMRRELDSRSQELARAVGEVATLRAQLNELSGAVDKTKITASVAAILAGLAATAGVASYFATTDEKAKPGKRRPARAQ